MGLIRMFKNLKKKDNVVIEKDVFDDTIFEKEIDEVEKLSADRAVELYKPDFVSDKLIFNKDELRRLILTSVVLGDISGSRYEGVPLPIGEDFQTIELFTEFHRFTDDTALTIAIYKAAQKIKSDGIEDEDLIIDTYAEYLRQYTRKYQNLSYGGGYLEWALSDNPERGTSYGNGACMRVGGIVVVFDDIEDVIRHAYYSAVSTHGHNEGLKGAICIAVIYWMLTRGASKNDVIRYLEKHYMNNGKYKIHCHTQMDDLIAMCEENQWSTLTLICQTSVPEAVIHFMESVSFESCLRNSYKYLCDRDTISAIAAPMAALFYNSIYIGDIDGEEIIKKYLAVELLCDLNN